MKRYPESQDIVNGWANVGLGDGMLAMVDHICGSPEALQYLVGWESGLNSRYIVHKRYRECYGRDPESREAVDAWLNYGRAKGPERLTLEICNQPEAASDSARRNAITLGYQDCYARDPEGGAVDAWMTSYVDIAGVQNLRKMMCSQPEAQGWDTLKAVVTRSYNRCLRRGPESDGIVNDWANYGLSKGALSMLDAICGSPEALTHL